MKRIQRRRTKGWRMPEGAVYVGRPGRFGNSYKPGETYMWLSTPEPGDDEPLPFPIPTSREPGEYNDGIRVERCASVAQSIDWYGRWARYVDPSYFDSLRGHDVACWCPLDQPCHADVLIEVLKR